MRGTNLILGLVYGVLGGGLGWAWMRGTNLIRANVLVPFKLGPRHIVKGLLGGLIIGSIGIIHPETLFWAEHEAQTIISHGEEPLPHVWPKEAVLGAYRGGFIFPFMFAGHSIGLGLAALANYSSAVVISPGAAALSMACAINVAVTRTVLATPIVLTTLSA